MRRPTLFLMAALLTAPAAQAGQDNPFVTPEMRLPHLPHLPAAALPQVPVAPSVPPSLAEGVTERLHVIAVAGNHAILTYGQEPDKRLLSVSDGQMLYFKGHRLKVAIDGLAVELLEGHDVVYAAELDDSQDENHKPSAGGGLATGGNGQR